MAMERVPYLVGGGFEHSAEVMRAMLATATSGAEGVVGAGDLRVTPTPVPGASIVVGTGNALIRNTYAGGGAQTYAVRAPSQTVLPITATGSAGGRSDLVIARIDDPTYQGIDQFDPATWEAARFEVIRGVSATQSTVAGLGITYPAIPLARITLPASTGTVTAGMITDLRRVALPQRERRMIARYGTGRANQDAHHVGSGYATWPIRPGERPRVRVPDWATKLLMNVTIAGAFYQEGTPVGETVYGFRTGFADTPLSQNGMLTIRDRQRVYINIIGEHQVPEHLRGTDQLLDVLATRTFGVGRMGSDFQTNLTIDYEFSQDI